MSDFQWSALIELAVKGAGNSASELKKVQDGIDQVSRAGGMGEKEVDKYTNAVNRAGRASNQTASKDLPKLRYALYDVAQTYSVISAAALGFSGVTLKAAADFESGFTRVERTSGKTGVGLERLRGELIELTTQIPQTFDEVSSLAARGAQLGIASTQLTEFTEVVAKFVATSDSVTLDQAVEAFGRISNLLGDDNFEAFGSAITLVGVNAAATEAQIVKTTQELAPFAAAVGLSTDEVIGLASSVASLGQPPERARSAFLTLQRVVDGAVVGMNDNLDDFAALLGMTEAEVANLWKTDPAQFIESFATALGGVDNLTVAFDQLGINERRAVQVFQALAADARNAGGELSVLQQGFRDSAQGYAESTELTRQYALIVDDLNSQLVILGNSFMALAASAGSEFVPALAGLAGALADVINNIREFTDTDVGGVLSRIALGATIAVGAFLAYRAAVLFATASTAALITAQQGLAAANVRNGLLGLIQLFIGYRSTAIGATGATAGLRVALTTLQRAILPLLIISGITSLFLDFRGTMINVGNAMGYVADIAHVASVAIRVLANMAANAVKNIPLIGDALSGVINTAGLAANALGIMNKNAVGDFQKWANNLPKQSDKLDNLSNSVGGAGIAMEDAGDLAGDFGDALGGPGGVGDSAAAAAEEVRTLADYANDLSSVFGRSFELRFGLQNAQDGTAKILNDLAKEAEESRKRIRDLRLELGTLRADLQGLQSDRSIQQQFLRVALEYGDTARAEAIRANIAKLDAEIAETRADVADKTKDLKSEQEKQTRTTKGNTSAAIDNRAKLQELIRSYQDQVLALANAGLSQDELRKRTEQLKREFIAQATQLGYNRTEVQGYAKAFDDMKLIIQNIPRNVTIGANVNPALQAIGEFNARLKAARDGAAKGIRIGNASGGGGGYNLGANAAGDYKRGFEAQMRRNPVAIDGYLLQGQQVYRVPGTSLKLYDSGGYTGAGAKMQPAGIVHRGEYVIPKKDVNQSTGLPHADALGRLQRGSGGPSYAGGGQVRNTGMGVVGLDARTIQAIARAVQPVLALDGQVVAQSSSNQYRQSTTFGSN